MSEVLMVAALIGILATLSLPAIQSVKRRSYESECIAKMANLAIAEKRYYAQFKEFGRFEEMVDAGLLPRGYRKTARYIAPQSVASVRPYIEHYSLIFTVPSTPNSLYFKIDALPFRQSMGLRTFNISLILDRDAAQDTLFTAPPVREGLSILGEPVGAY